MLIIPLNVMDENLGIITIDYNDGHIYHECLYEFIVTLDNILGTIKNKMELVKINKQLNTLSEQTIQSLTEIVEAKSEFTGLHVKGSLNIQGYLQKLWVIPLKKLIQYA